MSDTSTTQTFLLCPGCHLELELEHNQSDKQIFFCNNESCRISYIIIEMVSGYETR